jgi:hypothetical protein
MKNIIFEFFNFEGPTINNFLEKSTGQLINAENTINNQHQDLRIIYRNIDYFRTVYGLLILIVL